MKRAMYNIVVFFAKIIIVQDITSTVANINNECFRPMKDENTGVNKFPIAEPRSEVDAIHEPSSSVTGNDELLVKYGSAGEVHESTVPFPIVRMHTV